MVIEEELKIRTNEISAAGKAGIKTMCVLLNERKFRTKRWEKFLGDPNHLITRQVVENDL
jgi:hypothetical protein